jgi:transcriptional regulator, araC family
LETRSLHSTDLSKTEEIKPPASPDLLKKPKKPWRYQLFHFHRSAESRLISSVLDRSPHPRKQPQQCHDGAMYAEVQLGMGRTLWRSRQVAPSTIPADGCVDLIVSGDRVLLCGPQTRWIAAGASDSTGLLGIRLAPGTASALVPMDLPAVRDQIIDAQDVLSRSATPLCKALLRARDSSDPAAGLSPLASSAAPESWVTQIRQHAIAGASAREAATAMSWSERTLRRHMLAAFGYGYAALRRIVRARRAHRLIAGGTPPTRAATIAGYSDQAHLTREFTALIGMTPGELIHDPRNG